MAETKGNVLIVDDEAPIRHLLEQMLSAEGYRCISASNADTALNILQAEPVDVVLLDIKLPGKSGMELLPQIKKSYPDVVVIMATVLTDINIAIGAIRQGAYDYIGKPFNMDTVKYCVNRAIEKRRLEIELREYQQNLEEKVAEQNRQFGNQFMAAMQLLVYALEASDSYTAGHSRRVSEISLVIGNKMNLDATQMEDLRWGSLLHDIGKIGVSTSIINKPDKLSKEEYVHVMSHTIIGASIMQPVVRNEKITEIIEHHHDHYTGGGLNQKVQGEEIPLLARIVAVADAYDAMVTIRPYRPALKREQALNEIRNQAGRQFDPLVANIFLEISETALKPVKKKVLIVDDESSIRLLTKSILSNVYTVIEAANGVTALAAVTKHKPSLIIMDILMPEMDGLQTLHELKSNPKTVDIPVIMLTSLGQDLNRKLCEDLGASQYIPKPFSPQELLETVGLTIVK